PSRPPSCRRRPRPRVATGGAAAARGRSTSPARRRPDSGSPPSPPGLLARSREPSSCAHRHMAPGYRRPTDGYVSDMTHDVVIRGGTIVDGTGREGFAGDLAIDGDRIVEIGDVSGGAHRTIAAAGALVTPGFVNIHTHLDAQLAWDPDATSSCWHGVTSVVLG